MGNIDNEEEDFFNNYLERMSPIQYLEWYTKAYNNKYAKRFKKIETHIKSLDENNFRLPSERDPTLVNKMVDLYNRLSNADRPYVVYALIQFKDFKGNIMPRPPMDIGRTIQGIGARWSDYIKFAKYHSPNQLRTYGTVNMAIRRCIKLGLDPNDYFEMKVLDIAFSKSQLSRIEEFWQIYLNRFENDNGFDLRVNMRFNKIIGQLHDTIDPIQIDKGELEALITLGFRFIDLVCYFQVAEATINVLLNQYWPGKSYYQLQKTFIGQYILDLIEAGFWYDEIAEEFLSHGKLDSRSMRKWRDLDTDLRSEMIGYSPNRILIWCSDWFGRSFYELYTDLFIKPLIISLYREGRLTKDDILGEIKEGFGTVYGKPNPYVIGYKWGRGWILEFDLVRKLKRGMTVPAIAESWGLISQATPRNEKNAVIDRIYQIMDEIFGMRSVTQIREFLNLNYLGDHFYIRP